MLSYSFLVRLRSEHLDDAIKKIQRLDPIEWSIAGISSYPLIKDPGQAHYWQRRAWELQERVEMLESALDDCQRGVPPIAIA